MCNVYPLHIYTRNVFLYGSIFRTKRFNCVFYLRTLVSCDKSCITVSSFVCTDVQRLPDFKWKRKVRFPFAFPKSSELWACHIEIAISVQTPLAISLPLRRVWSLPTFKWNLESFCTCRNLSIGVGGRGILWGVFAFGSNVFHVLVSRRLLEAFWCMWFTFGPFLFNSSSFPQSIPLMDSSIHFHLDWHQEIWPC